MAIEISVPDIGIDEVEVTEVLVGVHDKVEAEQSIITVEGDKVSMEVPSPQAGIVKEVKVNVGDKVTTGKIIMIFEDEISDSERLADTDLDQEITMLKQNTQLLSTSITKSKVINMPDINVDEVEITSVLVKVGDPVKVDQSLIIAKSDKVLIKVLAPFAGQVKEIKISTGTKVSAGTLIMVFEVVDDDNSEQVVACISNINKNTITVSDYTNSKNQFIENDIYTHATPVIRLMARELGINLAKVKGTGRKGRILREDIQNYVKELVKSTETATTMITNRSAPLDLLPWPQLDFSKFGDIEVVDLGRIQKISGANLHRNWIRIPHITQFDDADITDVEAFRKQQNAEAEKKNLNLKMTLLVFIMKAVVKAMEELPRFNSSLSEDGQKLTLKKYMNIGVAVDTPHGLVVPVFRDVKNKSIIELSSELAELSKKARADKLIPSNIQGGCFTISSLGSIGGTAFTPIINAPEVAILGVSQSSIKPKWNGKEFLPRLILPLSLSYDHRVIDGADGARFLGLISNVMTDIRRLII